MSNREFTIVYKKRKDKYIAWIEEIPGVNTQGKTLKEIKENLKEALQLVLSANKLISMKNLKSGFKKESIQIPV
ncbi:MAG: type II toxin-antitoxin system HicB family antitoxin [Candidatus Paceibacteria bacterium]